MTVHTFAFCVLRARVGNCVDIPFVCKLSLYEMCMHVNSCTKKNTIACEVIVIQSSRGCKVLEKHCGLHGDGADFFIIITIIIISHSSRERLVWRCSDISFEKWERDLMKVNGGMREEKEMGG